MAFWKRWQLWLSTSDRNLARWLRAARDALLGEMPVLAAGTALFAIIAVVPALAAVVSIYGIAVDPNEIQRHLKGLETVMPVQVVEFVSSQLERMARESHGVLGFQIAGSLAAAMISARSSARSLIVSLNRAYRVREQRSAGKKLAMTLAMGAMTLLGLVIMFAILIALPTLVAALGLKGYHLVRILRWPLMLTLVLCTLVAMYRFAPSPRPLGTTRHVWRGALVATALLVLVSWALSLWVDHVASYDAVYGTFGSLIVIMLWFYLSTIALVIGGFVNGELEREAGAPASDRSMY
ncbi:MAG TPA: YihY/virulence factor BrkB family protein [Kofleriaceae bacterium]